MALGLRPVGNDEPVANATAVTTPSRLLRPLVVGTVLSPLNSSMVAVALVLLRHDFGVSLARVTWVVTTFYLTASASQPVMGRLGDLLGPRRIYLCGMVIVLLASASAPLLHAFSTLLIARALLALGTSAAFPSAVALLRHAQDSADVTRGLGWIATTNTLGAAVGPAVGGLLVGFGGWQALFLLNVPMSVIAILLVLRFIPADSERGELTWRSTLAALDVPGVVLFSAFLVVLLEALTEMRSPAGPPLLILACVLGVGTVWRERRTGRPFIDVAMAVSNRPLFLVYLQFALYNVVFYGTLFGLPQWLEESRHYSTQQVGAIVLSITAASGVATPMVSRLVQRRGSQPVLVAASLMLSAAVLLQLSIGNESGLWLIVVASVGIGLPFAFANLGLQNQMYSTAHAGQAGVAAGLLQMTRYVGAIAASNLLALVAVHGMGTAELHHVVWLCVPLCVTLIGLAASGRTARTGRTASSYEMWMPNDRDAGNGRAP